MKCVSTKLNELGLLPKKANKTTPKLIALRRLLYIPFIPNDHILAGYENAMRAIGKYRLKKHFNVIEAFDFDPSDVRNTRTYMQRVWIGQVNLNARSPQRFTLPMFSYSRWNAFASMMTIGARTNNEHENWNKSLASSIGISGSTGRPSVSLSCNIGNLFS